MRRVIKYAVFAFSTTALFLLTWFLVPPRECINEERSQFLDDGIQKFTFVYPIHFCDHPSSQMVTKYHLPVFDMNNWYLAPFTWKQWARFELGLSYASIDGIKYHEFDFINEDNKYEKLLATSQAIGTKVDGGINSQGVHYIITSPPQPKNVEPTRYELGQNYTYEEITFYTDSPKRLSKVGYPKSLLSEIELKELIDSFRFLEY